MEDEDNFSVLCMEDEDNTFTIQIASHLNKSIAFY